MSQPKIEFAYCRTCRRALETLTKASGDGPVRYLHTLRSDAGRDTSHEPDPVPLAELADPIQCCDFCSTDGVTYIYVCDDFATATKEVTAKYITTSDHRNQGYAARVRRIDTGDMLTQKWGDTWSACAECARIIENRDLMELVARVQAIFPPKMQSGKKLIKLRGDLIDTYEHFFATLVPRRKVVQPGKPLGVWEDEL